MIGIISLFGFNQYINDANICSPFFFQHGEELLTYKL